MIRPSDILSRDEIDRVRQKSQAFAAFMVLHAWAVIFAAMAVAAIWPNPLTILGAVIIIGGRQLGLAILMHEGSHGLLFKSLKVNDFVSQWLCAFPVFADTRPYRPYHMTHHRRTQQPDDPDLGLSKPFPVTRASLVRKLIRDITGQTGFQQRVHQVRAALKHGFRDKLGGPLTANALLAAGLTAAGPWWLYPGLWLAPLLTSYMVVLRIRNIAEHAVVPDNNDDFRNARTTYASPLMRLLLAPYYVNFHVEHHLFPFVPCYRLPEVHQLLLAKGYGTRLEVQRGYGAVLRLATAKAA